ncbi:hypothetical protein HYU15_00300 [Candidatus Woesearchaeota archaeon]|nr:hypothetical protein [Candidatus Woesearchaeota archaeon]
MSLDRRIMAVLGAGQLGYANAVSLSAKADRLILYDRNAFVTNTIESGRKHPKHFRDLALPGNVHATTSLEEVAAAQILFIDLHSEGIRHVFNQLVCYLKDGVVVVNDAKGLEQGTHKLPLQIVQEALSANGRSATLVARSGWMLAANMVNGNASYVDVACEDAYAAEEVSRLFSGSRFKACITTDVTGVQLAGVMKNVYAICAGLFDGLAKADPSRSKLYGDAKALYMAEATAEARQVGILLGARPETFQLNSYAWGSDYYSSCRHDTLNRLLGEQIGLGMKPYEAYKFVSQVRNRTPEGYNATRELYDVVYSLRVEMPPILRHAYEALFAGKDISQSLMEGAVEISAGVRSHHGRALVQKIGRFASRALRRINRARARRLSQSP